ncbi:hypothetical protein [Mycobacterium sp. URHB0021]|jgi:hypothetical protein
MTSLADQTVLVESGAVEVPAGEMTRDVRAQLGEPLHERSRA